MTATAMRLVECKKVWVQKLKQWSLIKLEAAIALRFKTPRYLHQRRQLWTD